MKKTKILIVEDEPLIARDIAFLLEDIGIQQNDIAMGFDEAITCLQTNSYDLVLLDINLSSERDGVDLAMWISKNKPTPFIFITSYYNASVVSRAKVTEPKAYLLKPFNKHDIQINVEMALYKSRDANEDEILFIKEKTGAIQVDQKEIIYLEADDNYTKVIFEHTELVISQTLKSIHEKLIQKDFVRVHKSYCVRLQKISMIKGGFVYLGDHKVPIGRSYKEDFMAQISLV